MKKGEKEWSIFTESGLRSGWKYNIPQVVSNTQDWKFCWEESIIVVTVEEGTEKLAIAKRDSSVLTHVLIYLYPGNPVT